MTMKSNISRPLTCGAILFLLPAASPAWGVDKAPGGIRPPEDSWTWFPPPSILPDLIHKKEKKKDDRRMHTVQEDGFVIDLMLDPERVWKGSSDAWTNAALTVMDVLYHPRWHDPLTERDAYRPTPAMPADMAPPSPVNTVPADSAYPAVPSSHDRIMIAWTFQDPPTLAMPNGAPRPAAPVPAPGALAMLALGAGSLLAPRRRR